MREFGGARNRHDKRLLVHQPGQSYLCRGNASCTAESVKNFHNTIVGAYGFGLEAWQGLPVVVGNIKLGIFIDHTAQKTTVQRTVWNETDAQILAQLQHSVRLYHAVHQVIFALDCRNRTYLVRTADGINVYFTHAPMQDFTFLDEFAACFSHRFNRCVRVYAVLVEHAQCFNSEIAQRVFTNPADVGRSAVLFGFNLHTVYKLMSELR